MTHPNTNAASVECDDAQHHKCPSLVTTATKIRIILKAAAENKSSGICEPHCPLKMISRAFSTAVKSGRGTARRVWHQNTLAQHADHLYSGADTFGDVAPPISMTTTFEKRSHRGESEGFAYSRDGRPTVSQAEAIIGKLEGGHAVLFASGQAATFSALTHFKPKRVFVTGGYHGTHQAIDLLTDLGVIEEKCELPENMLEQEFREGDLLWIESPRNPNCVITDIADARYIADRSGVDVKVVVDSTFAPPPLQQCLDLGAHAVMHSSTKYVSTVQADVFVCALS